MTTSPFTPLTSNLPAELQNNPLMTFGRGIAAYSEVKPEHIAPAIEYLLKHAQSAVDVAVSPSTPSTWDALAEPLEDATEFFSRSWSVISHLNSVADTLELRAAYGEMLPKVTAFFSSLGQNLDLYKKFKELNTSPDFAKLSAAQKKVIENSLRDFRLGGAELSDADKPRLPKFKMSKRP